MTQVTENEELPMEWLHSVGFPTFDEFRKNPDKWRKQVDEVFQSVDGSTLTFRERLKGHKLYWRDKYQCDSLEQVERIAANEGYTGLDLQIRPLVRSTTGTSTKSCVEIIIQFWPKLEYLAKGWKPLDG